MSNEIVINNVESDLSAMGAKLADAVDLSMKAQKMLIELQDELSDLYITLGENTELCSKKRCN